MLQQTYHLFFSPWLFDLTLISSIQRNCQLLPPGSLIWPLSHQYTGTVNFFPLALWCGPYLINTQELSTSSPWLFGVALISSIHRNCQLLPPGSLVWPLSHQYRGTVNFFPLALWCGPYLINTEELSTSSPWLFGVALISSIQRNCQLFPPGSLVWPLSHQYRGTVNFFSPGSTGNVNFFLLGSTVSTSSPLAPQCQLLLPLAPQCQLLLPLAPQEMSTSSPLAPQEMSTSSSPPWLHRKCQLLLPLAPQEMSTSSPLGSTGNVNFFPLAPQEMSTSSPIAPKEMSTFSPLAPQEMSTSFPLAPQKSTSSLGSTGNVNFELYTVHEIFSYRLHIDAFPMLK